MTERRILLVDADAFFVAVARMELGEAYRDVARYDDAARLIREALALDSGPAQYWNSLGTVLGAGGRMAEAERPALHQHRDPEPERRIVACMPTTAGWPSSVSAAKTKRRRR